MFIKRFIAKDMQEAIKKIRQNFGPDAVILDSKLVRNKGIRGLFKKRMVEVTAAYEPKKKQGNAPAQTTETEQSNPPAQNVSQQESGAQNTQQPTVQPINTQENIKAMQPSSDEKKIQLLNDQLGELKNVVEDFTNKIKLVKNEATVTFLPEIMDVFNRLVERDVSEEMAKQIAMQIQEASFRRSIEPPEVAKQLIVDKLGDVIPLKMKDYKQNVLLFAGATGAGKTTTLVKLAGMLAFEQNLSVGLINMDTYRVGAIEQIKIYSEIMDIPLETAYNAEELKMAIKALEDRDVVLIDTAGKSMGDDAYKEELTSYMDVASVDEVFLVLSVVTGNKVCREIVENFSFVNNYKLIITKLDEIKVWGNILNIAEYAKRPISYITNGQNVPGDICEVNVQKLADNITGVEVVL